MHIWIRAEVRDFEKRVGITPEEVTQLIAAGFEITVEESEHRAIPIKDYVKNKMKPAWVLKSIMTGLYFQVLFEVCKTKHR